MALSSSSAATLALSATSCSSSFAFSASRAAIAKTFSSRLALALLTASFADLSLSSMEASCPLSDLGFLSASFAFPSCAVRSTTTGLESSRPPRRRCLRRFSKADFPAGSASASSSPSSCLRRLRGALPHRPRFAGGCSPSGGPVGGAGALDCLPLPLSFPPVAGRVCQCLPQPSHQLCFAAFLREHQMQSHCPAKPAVLRVTLSP